MPCASAVKAIAPIPTFASTVSRLSSIQRLTSEYEGWWMISGVPSRFAIVAASAVWMAEYEEMRTIARERGDEAMELDANMAMALLYGTPSPLFDPDGKYLYFLSDRDFNEVLGNIDFEFANPKTTRVYIATLRKDEASPFPATSDETEIKKDELVEPQVPPKDAGKGAKKPESKSAERNKEKDNEKEAKDKDKDKDKEKPKDFRIDLDGIQNRIDPGDPLDKNLYELPPEELAKVPTVPDSLLGAIEALEKDHEFLLKGDVFTKDFLENWIELKKKEYDALRLRPHPYEFFMYFDL